MLRQTCITNLSYQMKALRTISPSSSPPSLIPIHSLTNMVSRSKNRPNKRKKDDPTPAAEPPLPQTQSLPTTKPATSPPRTATPPVAPPSAPTISTPTPIKRQVDESPLSLAANGSMSKKARRRQEALDRASIAACSRTEVSIKALEGTGPAEVVEDNKSENACYSPKTPQPEADEQPPSPTKPGSAERSTGKKSKRRYEQLDLNDEATAAAERKDFLKTFLRDDKTSKISSAIDSSESPRNAADQQSCLPTTSHRPRKHMSKKSRRN
jgi:hypothetical protein